MFKFTISNLAILISVTSLILSLYNFFYSLYSNHKRVKIDMFTFRIKKEVNYYKYNFCISISNCSNLPISINNICINNMFCVHNRKYLKHEQYTQSSILLATEDTFTVQFPINLSNLESKNCYIEIHSLREIDFDYIKFKLFTNRGCIKNPTVTKLNLLNDEDANF